MKAKIKPVDSNSTEAKERSHTLDNVVAVTTGITETIETGVGGMAVGLFHFGVTKLLFNIGRSFIFPENKELSEKAKKAKDIYNTVTLGVSCVEGTAAGVKYFAKHINSES